MVANRLSDDSLLRQQKLHIRIDCIKNTFTLSIPEPESAEKGVSRVSAPYFVGIYEEYYFTCAENSAIELDIYKKSIF